jgi:threonyl-tRNA synthetase
VQRSDQIGAVKLTDVSGSYWKGDEAGPKLQRIYGTAFASKKELKAHQAALEEARKRDHRRVGADLGLYAMDPLSPGSPFYLPRGATVYNELVSFMRSLYPRYGYEEVITPQLFRAELFKISGHYEKFHDDMFWFEGSDEGEELAIKAMNCPGHCELFGFTKHSYRDLPMRLAEFSRLHRNERSGTLNGLSRVRSMAQDDGHIYCEPEQVPQEIARYFEMVAEVYSTLGLEGVEMSVSTRPDEFLGEPEDWDVAEKALIEGVERAGFACGIKPKEAAFYAPKVECDFRDVLGRVWTLATLQIDMAMPGRFGLRYVGRDGELHQPAMLHRAVLGSIERFMAIYIEHTGGDFPFWLSPVQAAILPITERHTGYAESVRDRLQRAGVRCLLDDRSETLGFKIREAETQKIPLMLVVGDQESENGTVAPRIRKSQSASEKSQTAVEPIVVENMAELLAQATSDRRAQPLE